MHELKSRNTTASPQLQPNEGALSFGKVIKPHGLKGLLKIRPYRGQSEALLQAHSVWLGRHDRWTRVELLSVRRDRQWFLIELSDCTTRQEAEAWRGAELAIPREELGDLEDDEVYLADCIGLRAVTVDGEELGTIEGLIETGGHDLFEIQDDTHEILVPACAPFLVDVTGETVVLDRVEGLPRNRKPRKAR